MDEKWLHQKNDWPFLESWSTFCPKTSSQLILNGLTIFSRWHENPRTSLFIEKNLTSWCFSLFSIFLQNFFVTRGNSYFYHAFPCFCHGLYPSLDHVYSHCNLYFWTEQPKLTVVIKVIMSLKLDTNMLFSVLFSSESNIVSPKKADCNRKLILCS